MLNIPLDTKVECMDGPCGKTVTLVVNPATQSATYLIVRDDSITPVLEQMVPIDRIKETTKDLVHLDCTRAEFAELEPFVDIHFVENWEPGYDIYGGTYNSHYIEPYATSLEPPTIPVEHERIPAGQVTVHRGMQVFATDGPVGKIGELLIDPQDAGVTHLVLMEGHLWGKKEIVLPVSSIDSVLTDSVQLNIDKNQVNALPTIPIQRAWKEAQITDLEVMIWTFADVGTADQAIHSLNRVAQETHFKIYHSAVITKDQAGETSLKEHTASDAKRGALFGALTGGLLGLIAGPGGAIVGAVAGGLAGREAGRVSGVFPEDMLSLLQKSMGPGSSSLVMLVDGTWFDKACETLAEFGGVLLHKKLTDTEVNLLNDPGDHPAAE